MFINRKVWVHALAPLTTLISVRTVLIYYKFIISILKLQFFSQIFCFSQAWFDWNILHLKKVLTTDSMRRWKTTFSPICQKWLSDYRRNFCKSSLFFEILIFLPFLELNCGLRELGNVKVISHAFKFGSKLFFLVVIWLAVGVVIRLYVTYSKCYFTILGHPYSK